MAIYYYSNSRYSGCIDSKENSKKEEIRHRSSIENKIAEDQDDDQNNQEDKVIISKEEIEK